MQQHTINWRLIKLNRTKILFSLIFIAAVYSFVTFQLLQNIWSIKGSFQATSKPVVLSYVTVHIDLKGAPPKLEYLKALLPRWKELGANSLLIEYEDMYPYENEVINVSAKNRYDKSVLKNFLAHADQLGIEVIPLVQTFGHLEYALKLSEFQFLREDHKFPDTICPSKPESKELITQMLEQVIRFHTDVAPLKHIHIGCDEVYHINKCDKCVQRRLEDHEIFIDHLRTVAEIINYISPETTILIWDDMLRKIKPLKWIHIAPFDNIQPVYWIYHPPTRGVIDKNLFQYHKKFKEIWIASAYKGADGRETTVPDLQMRYKNHLNWMKLIHNYKFAGEDDTYNFKGIILTGWSRYSHMDPLCELLPVAMPSLVLNLIVIDKFRKGLRKPNKYLDELYQKYFNDVFTKLFHCDSEVSFINFNFDTCYFDGIELYKALLWYNNVRNDIRSLYDSVGYSIEYCSNNNILNVFKSEVYYNECKNYLRLLDDVERRITKEMEPYYESDVIGEYIAYKIGVEKTIVTSMAHIFSNFSKIRTWQRRP